MLEHARFDPAGDTVVIEHPPPRGANVRYAGEDVSPGVQVLSAGSVVGPAHVGVLASVGRERVSVHPRPRVGVLSTGDELHEGTGPLGPAGIRDANRHLLMAQVAMAGCQPVDLGIVGDDMEMIAAAMAGGAADGDAVVISGGVSVGDRDLVKFALESLAAGDALDAGGGQTGEAPRLRHPGRHPGAGVRASRQSGIGDGELRALRPPRPSPPGRASPDQPPGHRRPGGPRFLAAAGREGAPPPGHRHPGRRRRGVGDVGRGLPFPPVECHGQRRRPGHPRRRRGHPGGRPDRPLGARPRGCGRGPGRVLGSGLGSVDEPARRPDELGDRQPTGATGERRGPAGAPARRVGGRGAPRAPGRGPLPGRDHAHPGGRLRSGCRVPGQRRGDHRTRRSCPG